jgi:2-polyprenyl-3-methyl-5-hydroxy-6-metoxy-1,4-benzoquinol methylase
MKISNDFFDKKLVLDVGCGDGKSCMQIVKLYDPKFITGIDIDYKLIE